MVGLFLLKMFITHRMEKAAATSLLYWSKMSVFLAAFCLSQEKKPLDEMSWPPKPI